MQIRNLGRSDLAVSALGLGCMGMSEGYGPSDDPQSIATIERALDLEINFLDTADIYGLGHNEELIGHAVSGRRQKVVLATKWGLVLDKKANQLEIDGSPKHAKEACDASLRRLRMDVIDLYYLHRVDPRVSIEESVGAMSELVSQGKVRFIGLSEVSPSTLRRAHLIHPVTALQSEYSLWTRDVETEVLPVCRELGIGFVSFCPLGRGFLTGRIKSSKDFSAEDMRQELPRFQEENLQKNTELVKGIEEISVKKGCTPSQLALAWLLAQKDHIVPIPGTKRQKYLEENIGALDVQLSQNDMQRIQEMVRPDAVAGLRYAETMMRMVNR